MSSIKLKKKTSPVTATVGERSLPFTSLVHEQSSSGLSKLQQQPPVAAIWDSESAPKRHGSASRDGALCRGKVDIKRTLMPEQNPIRGDLKSSNGLATIEIEYYVENFRYLSKLNRTSPDADAVGEIHSWKLLCSTSTIPSKYYILLLHLNANTRTVDDNDSNSILESHPCRSKERPSYYIGPPPPFSVSGNCKNKKSCSGDSNLLWPQRPPTPVSPATTATTTSSRSSALKSSNHLNGSSKGINVRRYHPPPPPRHRSPNSQSRQVAIAAHVASSSSSSGSVKGTTANQLRELSIDIIQTQPKKADNGSRDLMTQCHARKKSIDEIPRHSHINEIFQSRRSRFAEVKDEWPVSRRNGKDTTAQLSKLCTDIVKTRSKKGNGDYETKSHTQHKKDIGVRRKSINEIPPSHRRSKFAEVKDEWSKDMRLTSDIEIVLRPCDDMVSCVSLPTSIRHL